VQQQPVPGLDGKFNLDVPSVGKLAAWLDKPLDKSQPDPGPLKVRAAFATDGAKASLNEATIEGKAVEVKASGSFDSTGKVPFLTAKINVVDADLNAYLPKSEPKKKAAPKKEEAPPKEPAGWSEEPLDFSPLSKANGDVEIRIGSLRYGDLTIKPGLIKAVIDNGVLKVSIEELKASGGNMTAAATVNTSSETATFDYEANISGIEARPLLKTFAGFDRLSGKAELQAKGTAQGNNQKEVIGSLNGDSLIKFLDGAIHGINLAATLRKAKSLGFEKDKAGESEKTDFAELSGSFVIKDGIVENHDLKMLAPLVRLSGEGTVPLPDQTVDYKATAKLVATLKGQGGQDALAGLPIPVRIKGPWSNVSYEVDWKSVLSAISLDPERLKNLPKGFQDIGKNVGIDLPIAEVPDVGGVGDVIKTLPGVLTGAEKQETPEGEAGEEEAPSVPEPLKQLKGLFGK
jgi:AsmA protein